MAEITYKMDNAGVDFENLRQALIDDDFHNGRSAEQYQKSAENSAVVCYVYDSERIIGNGRALSDGVCNAYIVDVWVHSAYRRRGIATEMMQRILNQLQGQHVYLFTDDRVDFYETLGFEKQPFGMSTVVGEWLEN